MSAPVTLFRYLDDVLESRSLPKTVIHGSLKRIVTARLSYVHPKSAQQYFKDRFDNSALCFFIGVLITR
jgi:hypothetical protein